MGYGIPCDSPLTLDLSVENAFIGLRVRRFNSNTT